MNSNSTLNANSSSVNSNLNSNLIRDGITLSQTQTNTVEWMQRNEKKFQCGALAHTVGVGKSMCAFSLTCTDANLKKQNGRGKNKDLYIVPPGLRSQWKEEMERLTHLKGEILWKYDEQYLLSLIESDCDVIITSYYLFLSPGINNSSLIMTHPFHRVFADEAHLLRNPQTLISQKLQKLTAVYRWAISGTFIINTPNDLFGLASFLKCEGYQSKKHFEKELKSGRLVKNILIQSTAEDIASLNLKDKIVSIESIEMTEKEMDVYNQIKRDAKKNGKIISKSKVKAQLAKTKAAKLNFNVNGTESSKLNQEEIIDGGQVHSSQLPPQSSQEDSTRNKSMMEIINQLRLASSDLTLVPNYSLPDGQVCSSQVKHLLKLVMKIRKGNPKEKILIFSSMLPVIDNYKMWLEKLGQRVLYYTGKLNPNERDEIIDAFKSDTENQYPILILGIMCANSGLNLQVATRVIIFPFWNEPLLNQCVARAFRKGQKETVYVYYLLCKNTIEEKIYKMALKKDRLNQKVLTKSTSASTTSNNALSVSEMKELLDIN